MNGTQYYDGGLKKASSEFFQFRLDGLLVKEKEDALEIQNQKRFKNEKILKERKEKKELKELKKKEKIEQEKERVRLLEAEEMERQREENEGKEERCEEDEEGKEGDDVINKSVSFNYESKTNEDVDGKYSSEGAAREWSTVVIFPVIFIS